MVKKITFKIDVNGEVSLGVEGAQGNECERLTEPFEALLGGVEKRDYKDSYYAGNGATDQLELHQGEEP